MEALSHNFADVAALRKRAVKRRVSVEKLHDMLSPYAFGDLFFSAKGSDIVWRG